MSPVYDFHQPGVPDIGFDPAEEERWHDQQLARNNGQIPSEADDLESFRPVDLGPIVAGTHRTPIPELLVSMDTRGALLYRRSVNGFHGDSGIGKTLLVLAAVAQILKAGRRVIYLDYEGNAAEIVDRLTTFGVSTDEILAGLIYIQPNEPATPEAVRLIVGLIDDAVDLIVIDSLGEAFALEGIDENLDRDVGPWMRQVPRRLAEAGPAVAIVDHSTKANDNPLHPSGSKRKRAAITGASYLVTTGKPPTRTEPGTLTLTCAKDRRGTYARGKVAATVDITPYPDGGVTANVYIATPTDRTDDPVAVVIARQVVRLVKNAGRPMTGREIRGTLNVKASDNVKLNAIEVAIGEGCLRVEPGPRRAHLHHFVRDFEPEADR